MSDKNSLSRKVLTPSLMGNFNQLTSYNEQDFVHRVQSLPEQIAAQYESYCLSPNYYKFTGRNGLWVYSSKDSIVIICRHPNDSNRLLLFPEVNGDGSFNLTLDILSAGEDSLENMQLARFTSSQKSKLKADIDQSHLKDRIYLVDFKESILDWVYPISVLNTKSVIDRKGSGFAQLRQRLNKLEKRYFSVSMLDIEKHRDQILEFAYGWSNNFNSEDYTLDDLVGPCRELLSIIEKNPQSFGGQVIMAGDQLKSYCIWETPISKTLPANEFAVASCSTIEGLSEWQIVKMCEQLYDEGCLNVNLGGSETHGLDRFKRKFMPSERIELHSAHILSQFRVV